jgi:putative N-acetylmannosamine-6-phosphate epimerase
MEENNKNNYVTEEHLDKRLNEQTQVIIEAVDSVLNKRLSEMNTRTDSRFEAVNNRFDAIDSRLDDVESGLGKKIDNVQILIDGYVKAQEDFKQEFVIMKEEFKQMKQIIKEKLGIEIRAI